MVEDGLDEGEARQRFYVIDKPGLLIDDNDDLKDFQKPFARSRDELAGWAIDDHDNIGLLDVVKNARPTLCASFADDALEQMIDDCRWEPVYRAYRRPGQ